MDELLTKEIKSSLNNLAYVRGRYEAAAVAGESVDNLAQREQTISYYAGYASALQFLRARLDEAGL